MPPTGPKGDRGLQAMIKYNPTTGTTATDITGHVFGKLTAIRRVENYNGDTMWCCSCECGGTHTVATRSLRAGYTKSCGCDWHPEHDIEKKLWSRVVKTDVCWLWTGPVNADGYGSVTYKGREWRVHRLAWFLKYGPIPKGLCVCHHCDTPACVNVERCLFLGTDEDNARDRESKGRGNQPRGEHVSRAKLTGEKVDEIRLRVMRGETHEAVAKNYNVTKSCVTQIMNKRSWGYRPFPTNKHIKDLL